MIVNYHKKVVKFLDNQDNIKRAQVERLIQLLDKYGHTIGMPYSRALGQGLFELRCQQRIHTRLLYCYYAGTAVILLAIIKKRNRLAVKDIELARRRMNDLT